MASVPPLFTAARYGAVSSLERWTPGWHPPMLESVSSKDEDGLTRQHYVKTQLWRSVLELDTDPLLAPIQKY